MRLTTTTWSLRSIMVLTSILRPLRLIPWRSARSRMNSNFSEVSSSALDGMQPTFRQVPPRAGLPCLLIHSSATAVFMPSWAQRMAAT